MNNVYKDYRVPEAARRSRSKHRRGPAARRRQSAPLPRGTNPLRPHETLFWRPGAQWAVRQGDWRLVRYDQTLDTPGTTSVQARLKVTLPRLYNLAIDPGEAPDLATLHAEKTAELLRIWKA